MSASKKTFRYAIVIGTFLLTACTEKVEKEEELDCFVQSGGERLFFGSPECVAQFDTKKMSGYWFVAFETSLFFPTKFDLERGSIDGAYSLDFLGVPSDKVSELLDSPSGRVFHVSFNGSKSEARGIYGTVPDLRGGIVVKEGFTIGDEIRDVPTIY